MSDQKEIPVLTDMIEKGIEIKMSDLGLEESPDSGSAEPFIVDSETEIAASEAEVMDPFEDNPALEKAIRRILDEHTELAWQEIKLVIRRHLDKL